MSTCSSPGPTRRPSRSRRPPWLPATMRPARPGPPHRTRRRAARAAPPQRTPTCSRRSSSHSSPEPRLKGAGMAGIDINRTTSGVVLPPEISSEIWANMIEASAVQQLARRIDLPGPGVTIPIITGDPEADWVAETDHKPVSRPSFSSKDLTPYTLAVIVPFSNQFRRDLNALSAECVRRLPGALAKKFDQTVFASSGAPGLNFAQLGGATA